MFDDEDEVVVVNTKKKKKAKNVPVVKSQPKQQVHIPVKKQENKTIRTQAGQYSSKETTVVSKCGTYAIQLLDTEAARLTDHDLYCYMYKAYGLKASQVDIIRGKAN